MLAVSLPADKSLARFRGHGEVGWDTELGSIFQKKWRAEEKSEAVQWYGPCWYSWGQRRAAIQWPHWYTNLPSPDIWPLETRLTLHLEISSVLPALELCLGIWDYCWAGLWLTVTHLTTEGRGSHFVIKQVVARVPIEEEPAHCWGCRERVQGGVKFEVGHEEKR